MSYKDVSGQSAIEYLMTYGWMLLVVAIVGGTIFSVAQSEVPESTSGFTGQDVQVDNFGVNTERNLEMVLRNVDSEVIEINSINVSDTEGQYSVAKFRNIEDSIGVTETRSFLISDIQESDAARSLNVEINYNVGNLENLEVEGAISGNFELQDGQTVTVDGNEIPKNLVVSSRDNNIYVYDIHTPTDFELIETLDDTPGGKRQSTYSPTEKLLAVSGGSGVFIFDTEGWSLVEDIAEVSSRANDFSNDGEFLAVASSEDLLIYDVDGFDLEQNISDYDAGVAVQFSPRDDHLALDIGSNISILDTSDWSEIDVLNETTETIRGLGYSNDGEYLAYAGDEGKVFVHETGDDFKLIETIDGEGEGRILGDIEFTDDKLAYGDSGENTVYIYDLDSFELVESLTESSSITWGFDLDFSEQGNMIAYTQYHKRVYVHETDEWDVLVDERPVNNFYGSQAEFIPY